MNVKTVKAYYAETRRTYCSIAYLFCGDTLLKDDLLPASKDIAYKIPYYNVCASIWPLQWRVARVTRNRKTGEGRLRHER